MVVLKFGGTSVSTKENIHIIANIIKHQKDDLVVIVSALKGITNLLVELGETEDSAKRQDVLLAIQKTHSKLCDKIWVGENNDVVNNQILNYIQDLESRLHHNKKINLEEKDALLSFGEILSSYIVTQALQSHHIDAVQVVATDLLITDHNFGEAEYLGPPTENKLKNKLLPLIERKKIPIITGFIGTTIDGKITTLGRGGSDYSAAIIAACLNANELQIWTDVNGILTADPTIIEDAKTIENISYEAADAFATSGAKVLHYKTLSPSIHKHMLIHILNTFNPAHTGTVISYDNSNENTILYGVVHKQISNNKYQISLIGANLHSSNIPDVITRLIPEVNIEIITVNKHKISFSVESDNPKKILKVIHNYILCKN